MKQYFGKYSNQIYLLLAILAGGLAIFAAWKLYKWLNPTEAPAADETVVVNQNNLSYAIGDYGIMADGLEGAMQASGTDENVIKDIFLQMQTADDLRQLIVAFGKRTNHILGIPQYTESLPYW